MSRLLSLFRGLIALGVIGLSLGAISAHAQAFDAARFADTPLTLPNGIVGKIYKFESHSPKDYANVIAGDFGPRVTLNGQLFMPAHVTGPTPVVVIVPGSGNLASNYFSHAAALTSAGIAAFAIDPFTGRGVSNTIADQNQFSFAASAFDVLAAINFVRTLPDIDVENVGTTGGSRGGTAVLMADTRPMSDAVLGPHHGARAVVPGYPWCGVQFFSGKMAEHSALLIMSGDRDDWVSPIQCEDAVHAMVLAGTDARMELFPQAHHSFDRKDVPLTHIPEALKSLSYPTIYMDDQGVYYNPRTGRPDPQTTNAALTAYSIKGGFIEKGATIGGTPELAVEFEDELVAFFKAKL